MAVFHLYFYIVLAPLPLASFAGEGTSFAGTVFLKGYVGVCLEGAIIVLVRWDSGLLEFLMQVSVVDEFTMELAEMISGNLHVTALLEQEAEAGNFLTQENGVYRLRSTWNIAVGRRKRSGKSFWRSWMRSSHGKSG